MARELFYTELRRLYTRQALEALDTEQGEPAMIGQERAAGAMRLGLGIKAQGYHIFVSGLPGTGKMTFAKRFATEQAAKEPAPRDLCYTYHFKDPQRPRLLTFSAGQGKLFKEHMEELIHQLAHEIPRIFKGDEFEEQKNEIVKNYQDQREGVIKQITEDARDNNFGVKMTSSGIYFMPIVDGEIISEEEYEALSDGQKDEISSKSEIIQDKAMTVMHQISEFEKSTQSEVDALEYNTGLFIIGRYINRLYETYADNEGVLAYLAELKEDLLDNIGSFLQEDSEETEALQSLAPWISRRSKEDFLSKYKVNLLTDNSGCASAPVIVDYHPTYANLVGEVEYDSEYGNFTTDYMKIRPGLLHRANGGYLILQVQDVISNPHVWETLKRVIRTGRAAIEPVREYATGIAVSGIKPALVDIHVKIILVGTSFYYELLREYDDEFQKFFKIHALFDYEMPYSEDNARDMMRFIRDYAAREGLRSFDYGAMEQILFYTARMAEHQDKLSTQFGLISEILVEGDTWAGLNGHEVVTETDIQTAVNEKEKRSSLYEEKLSEMIDENIVMIHTDGAAIGQINGLAVLDTGDFVFAKPARITATTYLGKAGIVNIEKEAEMSGAIHDKGMEVITGYLGQTYAQEFPLSLSCRVCFEQNYSGIDGDSASSTELYAILSSLADAPIRQDIAVTGSINQKGQIQAIGGVTHKIEGFFGLCRKRGLTGRQGVMIPAQNVKELMLKDEVAEAVREGRFHIYAISTLDEGIELLTGVPAGQPNEKGKYPADCIHGRAYKKLKEYHKKSLDV